MRSARPRGDAPAGGRRGGGSGTAPGQQQRRCFAFLGRERQAAHRGQRDLRQQACGDGDSLRSQPLLQGPQRIRRARRLDDDETGWIDPKPGQPWSVKMTGLARDAVWPAPQRLMRRAAPSCRSERFQTAQHQAQREADGCCLSCRSRGCRLHLVHGRRIKTDQAGTGAPGFARRCVVRFERDMALQRANALAQAAQDRAVRQGSLRLGKKRPGLQIRRTQTRRPGLQGRDRPGEGGGQGGGCSRLIHGDALATAHGGRWGIFVLFLF